ARVPPFPRRVLGVLGWSTCEPVSASSLWCRCAYPSLPLCHYRASRLARESRSSIGRSRRLIARLHRPLCRMRPNGDYYAAMRDRRVSRPSATMPSTPSSPGAARLPVHSFEDGLAVKPVQHDGDLPSETLNQPGLSRYLQREPRRRIRPTGGVVTCRQLYLANNVARAIDGEQAKPHPTDSGVRPRLHDELGG